MKHFNLGLDSRPLRPCLRTLLHLLVLFFIISTADASEQRFFREIWQEAGTLPAPRSDFGILFNKNTFYLMGGTDNTKFLNTVLSGKILTDGSLGHWKKQPALNSARSFFATVFHNDFIYILGGSSGTYNEYLLNTVERAKVNPDGSLSEWKIEKHPLRDNVRCLKAVFYGGYIYTVGGWNGAMMSSVDRARVYRDGSLGKWETLYSHTIYPRYIHGILLAENTIFAFGGHDVSKGSGISQTEYADIGTDGGLGDWKLSSPLPEKLFGAATLKLKDHLVLIGGREKHTLSASVYTGRIDLKSKKIFPWNRSTDLEHPLEHAGVFHQDNNLYVLGGSNNRGARKNIFTATVTPDGKIGNFLSKGENDAIETYNLALDAFSQNDLTGAISGFIKSIGLNSKLWDAYYNLGLAYMMNDEDSKTISLMNSVIQLNSGYEDAYTLLAILYDKKQDIENSLKYLELAIKNGFGDMSFIINTPDLKNIRSDKRFEELVEGYSSSFFMF